MGIFDGYYPENNNCVVCKGYTPYFQIPLRGGRARICEECFDKFFSCGMDSLLKEINENIKK